MTAVLPAPAAQEVSSGPARGPARGPASTPPRSLEPSARADAARAGWLFALALDLVTAGDEDGDAVRAILGQAGATAHARALAGAYGRAVAFYAEHPEDRTARQTVQVLAKALGRHHRQRALAPPA